MSIQEYYARQACKEINIYNPEIQIDHINGKTIVNGKVYGIILPKTLIKYCRNLWNKRVQDFYFKGNIAKNREWIRSYSNVYESNRGRNKDLKYTLDQDYFTNLSRTKFGLSPIGECPWSYRFFETIACGAIPILGDNDNDIFAKDYIFFHHSDKKNYNKYDVMSNFNTLLHNVTL